MMNRDLRVSLCLLCLQSLSTNMSPSLDLRRNVDSLPSMEQLAKMGVSLPLRENKKKKDNEIFPICLQSLVDATATSLEPVAPAPLYRPRQRSSSFSFYLSISDGQELSSPVRDGLT